MPNQQPLRRPTDTSVPLWDRTTLAIRRLDRRRLIALSIGFVVAWSVFSTVARARQTVDQLGRQTEVFVVDTFVPAGTELTASMISTRLRPVGLIPLADLASGAIGRTARVDLVPGEVLVEPRLFPADGRVDAGDRLIALPLPISMPALVVGSTVELIGLLPPEGPIPSEARVLARGVVTDVGDDSVSVAVAGHTALVVVEHLVLGTVEIVVLP